MALRRGQRSPLEIMRGRDLAPRGDVAELPSADTPVVNPGADAPGLMDRLTHPGRLMSGPPIVLRVPRGLAMLSVAVLLALLVFTFFAGQYHGWMQGEHQALVNLDATRQAIGRGQPAQARTTPGELPPRRGRIYLPNQPDPREEGLNYLILARYPLDEAQRLTEFLADQGLDSVIVPSHNAALFQVIALHGFTREQYQAEEHRAFEREIHRIGQRWREINAGRGDDLRSRTYWARYEPRS